MRVRALDSTGDWTFGAGANNYKAGRNAVAQDCQTRLSSVLGNCFFDLGAGIDWFNYLGSTNQIGLNLAISAVLLNTEGVTGIVQVFSTLNVITRNFLVQYSVTTIFGPITSSVQLPFLNNYLTDQQGDPFITQGGDNIII